MATLLIVPIIGGALVGWLFSTRAAAFSRRGYISIGILSGFLSMFLSIFLLGSVYGLSITELTIAICFDAIILGIATWIKQSTSKATAPQSATKAPAKPMPGAATSRKPESKPTGAASPPTRSQQEQSIFISYRRDDAADVAGRIYDRLSQHFGSTSVFKDVDSIPLGVDFRRHLSDTVGQCSILLAIIGRQWLTTADETGRRRLDDPRDFVRIEIEAALQRNIPVIPLLVQGATMPPEEKLPASLQNLTYRNGAPIRTDPDFHRDVDRLIQALDAYLKQPSPKR